MHERLTGPELARLIERVFKPSSNDHTAVILVDLPDDELGDNDAWRERRRLAAEWVRELRSAADGPDLRYDLVLYRNVHRNNAGLPSSATRWDPEMPLPSSADELDPATARPFEEIFATATIFLAPTELSATAPLKLAARKYGFRAATMPGFSPAMIPALRLDYTEVDRRVNLLKDLLDRADGAQLRFRIDGAAGPALHLDLRHRTAHASSGLFPRPGLAGNLPSGEAYIVPYEGEIEHDPSRSAGILPVELDGEIVVYRIEANRAAGVASAGVISTREANLLAAEPAYGNLAELGLGVLSGFGIQPAGEVLLDEKLGLHIAFGRSDHFGGQVGVPDFSTPSAAVHIDRVYVPQLQPRVAVASADLEMSGGETIALMREGRYTISFE